MMKQSNSEEKPFVNDWTLLGQLKLSSSSLSMESINNWLEQILRPIQVPSDLFSKLQASITAMLLRSSTNSGIFNVPSISVYVSRDVRVKHLTNGSWGFFKLEKAAADTIEGAPDEHVVEYYVYLDR